MSKRLLHGLIASIIILTSASLSYYWLTQKPIAKHSIVTYTAPLVNIITPTGINHTQIIHAMGQVIPAQQVNLTSRINGMITSVSPHFIDGGLFKKGEQIVQLDPTDYQLNIKQKENILAKAHFDLTLEKGQQAIAKREFQLLKAQGLNPQSQALVLRKPHLILAKSNVVAAQSALKQARLDLQRTKTVSPFNAISLGTNAHVGSWVSTFSTGTPLIKLAATDKFWILTTLSVNKLKYLKFPDNDEQQGAAVKIFYKAAWGEQRYRMAYIKRLKASLEDSGRMAEILIEIEDPLSLQKANKNSPKLLLGAFVRAEIQGPTLNNVLSLPEKTLHDGQTLWLLDENNQLVIKQITVLWQEQGSLFIRSDTLPDNPRIISTLLAAPLNGMKLRLNDGAPR